MNEKEKTRISKFLSLVLRHQPEKIGLILDENGWANIAELQVNCAQNGYVFNLDELKDIVETNNKKRFSLDDNVTHIRANQGHSIEVDLDLESAIPPAILYHGTAEQNVSSIQEIGIEKRSRQHVHLSSDQETAKKVGSRHGKPIILPINTAQMHADGIIFYLSANGVWLTDYVDSKYIMI